METELQILEAAVKELIRDTAYSSPLSRLIVLQPDRVNNQVGSAVLAAVTSHVKTTLPGGIPDGFYPGIVADTGPFSSLFYPNNNLHAYDDVIAETPGISQESWTNFSTAVLCQAIYHISNRTRQDLRKEEIDNHVQNFNQQIVSAMWWWYAQIFSRELNEYKVLVASMGGRNEALQKYEEVLQNPNWWQMINETIRSGKLSDPEWFFYHHWIKLYCLGSEKITQIIDTLTKEIIDIPITVRSDNWKSYRPWFPVSQLNYDQFREAEGRILASAYSTSSTEFGPFMVDMPEYYSKDFVSGPGKAYLNPPSSCFAAGAKVRMADGTLKAIEAIQLGDLVQTPNGARPVVLLVKERREERFFFSIAGCDARFTALHPFRCASKGDEPRLACVEPRHLAYNIPTMQHLGIQSLESGTTLLAYTPQGPRAVTVERLDSYAPDPAQPEDEQVYDLILEPDESGVSEYYVGDERQQFLVLSEIPLFMDKPLLTQTVLTMLSTLYPQLDQSQIADESEESWLIFAEVFSRAIVETLSSNVAECAEVGHSLVDTNLLPEMVAEHLDFYRTSEGPDHFNRSNGRLITYILAKHAEELEAAIQMGWRQFSTLAREETEVLAVSVLSLNLDAEYATTANLQLSASMSQGDVVLTSDVMLREKIEAAHFPFKREFYEVLYFDPWPPTSEEGIARFEFEVHGSDDPGTSWTAKDQMIWPPRENYQHRHALIYNQDGKDCGFMYYDIRLISPEDREREQMAQSSWNEEKKHRFSGAFGQQLGTLIADRLLALNISR